MSYRFHDHRRTVLRLSGKDVAGFLQNLVTNDVTRLSRGAVYAALLSPQGKYLADFILSQDPDGAILMDVASDQAPGLTQKLSLYKLRADVTITATEHPVICLWGGEDLAGLADPRHPGLGTRVYEHTSFGNVATVQDYTALRISLGVPAAGAELIPNESYILEHGFEALNGVDFRKGCYVGQEVTARMKHKTELRKGLIRVAIDGSAAPQTSVKGDDGRAVGMLHSVAGSEGLAYVRFDRISDRMTAGDARLTRL